MSPAPPRPCGSKLPEPLSWAVAAAPGSSPWPCRLQSVYPAASAVLFKLRPIMSLSAQNPPGAPFSTWRQTQGLAVAPRPSRICTRTPSGLLSNLRSPCSSWTSLSDPRHTPTSGLLYRLFPPMECYSLPSDVHMACLLLRSAQCHPHSEPSLITLFKTATNPLPRTPKPSFWLYSFPIGRRMEEDTSLPLLYI